MPDADAETWWEQESHRYESGAEEWRLLLQLGTEDGFFQFGDMGNVYFWVRADEARRGNFENAWLILQC